MRWHGETLPKAASEDVRLHVLSERHDQTYPVILRLFVPHAFECVDVRVKVFGVVRTDLPAEETVDGSVYLYPPHGGAA